MIDGTRIVFHARSGTAKRFPLAVQDSASSVLDPTANSSGPYPSAVPYFDYRANDGWLAYDKVVGATLLAAVALVVAGALRRRRRLTH